MTPLTFYPTFDHSSYSKKLCNYHLFYCDLIHHQMFFKHDINIFIFAQKFWIKRMVKRWLKSQRRHTLKYGGSIILLLVLYYWNKFFSSCSGCKNLQYKYQQIPCPKPLLHFWKSRKEIKRERKTFKFGPI